MNENKNVNRPKRPQRAASRDSQNERLRRVRERDPQKTGPKEKRDFTRKTEKTKINPKARGF